MRLPVLVVATLALTTPLWAAEQVTVSEPAFGCRDIEVTNRAFKLAVDDEQASLVFLTSAIISGSCVKLSAGSVVFVDDRKTSSSGLQMLQIRTKGDPGEYWVWKNATNR